jgi:hypothetical protein
MFRSLLVIAAIYLLITSILVCPAAERDGRIDAGSGASPDDLWSAWRYGRPARGHPGAAERGQCVSAHVVPRAVRRLADGLGPVSRRVNKGGTPTVALIASRVVSLIFISGGGLNRAIATAFNRAIAIAAFFVADYALSFIAVFVLRRREPNRPRPYRAIGHPWTTGLVLAGSIVFLAGAIAADHENSLWALAVLLVSWPAFLLTGKRSISQGLGAKGIGANDL